ncbi:hypothetical protein RS030_243611 [Cryptosporidium xiaoi]|uniref:Uncharacterized protein n=1 Tax=Cryptosporidium xiaoi TaxID=659607 RepID=A0AAV9XWJ5_9CRYT
MKHENEGGYVREYDTVTSDSKNSMEFNLNSKEDLNAKMGELDEEVCLEFNEDINNEKNTVKKEEMNTESCHDDNKKCIINNKCNNEVMSEYSKYSYLNDDNSDEENDELLIEMAKNGISSNENCSKLPLLLWDDNMKSKLKNKIYQTSRKMYLKYGNDGNCFNNFDYIPYFCNNHNIYFSNNKSEYSNMDNIDNAIFESKSCSDCKLSILDNFIKVIVDTIDKHIEFPPTIQRICELLCYPDCYTNTKSFLYALDKVS